MAVYTSRPVFGQSVYVAIVISLVVMTSEAQTGTTSSTIKSNTDLPLCTCDMTANECDVNCCCDKDCDSDDRKAFSRCIDEQTISDSQMCVKESLIFFDNTPYTKSYRGSWLCIHIDNFQERNFFKEPQTVVNEADFDKFRATYGGYSYNYEEQAPQFHGDFYRSGDPILTVYQGEVQGVLGLPAPLSTSKCADNNPAVFLYNEEFECEREVDMTTECSDNPFINGNLYFRGFKLIISPSVLTNFTEAHEAQTTTTSDPGTTDASGTTDIPVTTTTDSVSSDPLTLYNSSGVIDIELFSVTCFDQNSLEVDCDVNTTDRTVLPKPRHLTVGKGPALCQYAVTEVEYFIKHGGKLGLEKASVKITLTDFTEDIKSITQKFKITFYKSGDKDIFKRSGRPGYVVGQPVMAGRLVKNTTVEGKPSRQAIELHKDRSKWLTVVSNSINGDCVSSPEHRVSVTFGEEMRAGCKIRVSLQNLTNNCAFIQDAVLDALRGNSPPTHVATFGDSSITVVGDWVAIQGLYTQPSKAQKAQDGVCRNLVVGMLTQIVYADIGSLQQPQAKILGVLVTYQTDMVKFQCVGRYCQPGNTDLQNIEVVSTVSFIDISTAATASSGKRPTLPLRLPSDFFYPFT